MGGDFNTVLRADERKGGGIKLTSLKAFNFFILSARVIDITLNGISFTWSNNRENVVWARLDKFLISSWILAWFPKLFQRGIPRSISDHNAILLGAKRRISSVRDMVVDGARLMEPNKAAVTGCDGNKMPGTDGLNMNFVKANWEFADDTILFLKPKAEYHINARRLLRCFELAAGLKLNWHKTFLVKLGKGGPSNVEWTTTFHYHQTTLPITYLGLPFRARPSLKRFWDPVVNHIESRMAPWKRKFLTKGGDEVVKKAYHAVNWEVMCKSKKLGGLGIGRMEDKNRSLLTKWIWRFGFEDKTFWRRIICAKYGIPFAALNWDWKTT
ncbi:hypothetical protein Ddye_022596 [Dipteronia dyeriana]|uniref:Reverse transcriptase domain-containing protein n=1 Tax=Dipteronia dyeriana TaxID=168575 RepID=A0AAD9WSH2_9ROSI|nr:hypothetical protein Ddye_022596 [Dipteronia dyeriana]